MIPAAINERRPCPRCGADVLWRCDPLPYPLHHCACENAMTTDPKKPTAPLPCGAIDRALHDVPAPTTPTGDAEIVAWLRREAHGHAMAHEERHMSDIEVYRSQERAHRYRQAADAIERLSRATPPQPDAVLREALEEIAGALDAIRFEAGKDLEPERLEDHASRRYRAGFRSRCGRIRERAQIALRKVRALAAAPAAVGWIACSDRLPEERRDVLVAVDWEDGSPLSTMAGFVSEGRWCKMWTMKMDGDDRFIDGVTHWRPLPAPPRPSPPLPAPPPRTPARWAGGGGGLAMENQEAFYDAEIAPALLAIGQRCMERGMSMHAGVEFDAGVCAWTRCLGGQSALVLRLIDVLAQSNGNIDLFIMSLMRHAQEHGHSSVILARLGVPTTPAAALERGASEPAGPAVDGVALIAAERKRQVEAEGWTPEHDDEHEAGEFIAAAVSYAMAATPAGEGEPAIVTKPPALWPWSMEWWKPRGPIPDLVRAGALIAAEIDRLQRAAALERGEGEG